MKNINVALGKKQWKVSLKLVWQYTILILALDLIMAAMTYVGCLIVAEQLPADSSIRWWILDGAASLTMTVFLTSVYIWFLNMGFIFEHRKKLLAVNVVFGTVLRIILTYALMIYLNIQLPGFYYAASICQLSFVYIAYLPGSTDFSKFVGS